MSKKFSLPQWLRPFIFAADRDRSPYYSKITDLGFGIILLGLIFCGLAAGDAWTRHVYQKNGVPTKASVLYWTSSVENVGKFRHRFYTAHISYRRNPQERPVSAEVGTLLKNQKDVDRLEPTENILYLPNEPKDHVLFEKSLYPENFVWYQHWYNSGGVVVLGIIIALSGWIRLKIKGKNQKAKPE